MPKDTRWRVQVYLRTFNKLDYWVGYETEAREYATFALERGCKMVDERGVETYFPTHMIHKVKIFPPGVEPGTTETKINGSGGGLGA